MLGRSWRSAHWSCLILVLASCTTSSPITFATAPPRPQAEPASPPDEPEEKPIFAQIGLASWYGAQHQGRKTASGEPFDMNESTAAHRTLPLDTKARVTNLQNGRSVDVWVNDRGPFVKGRIIDLSAKAAKDLGLKQDGVARVKVEVMGDPVVEAGE